MFIQFKKEKCIGDFPHVWRGKPYCHFCKKSEAALTKVIIKLPKKKK